MFLLIDLSENNQIHLALFDESFRVDETYEGRNKEILQCIDRLLQQEGKAAGDIRGMMVVVGSGSFTSTRLSATVANTFAYVQQIPLLAISVDQVSDVQSLIPELQKQPAGQYLSATYSGVPNVGR